MAAKQLSPAAAQRRLTETRGSLRRALQ